MKKNFGDKKTENVKDVCNKLLSMFENGNMPKAIAKSMIRKSGDATPSDTWSIGNKILMYINDTEDARGIKQWNSIGRKLKKGTKAFYILAPMRKSIEAQNDNGEIEKKHITIGFNLIPVYRFEDTEGEEITIPEYTPNEFPPLYNVAKKLNLNVKYIPFHGKAWGSFIPGRKQIKLATHDADVFFHELGHAVHNTIKPLKGGQHKDQEIVAEMVSATLCEMYGLEGYIEDSYKYIKSYSNKQEPKDVVKSIMKVLGEVEEVLNIILTIEEEIQMQEAI